MRLALVEGDWRAALHLGIKNRFDDERALDPADLAQGCGHVVLAWIGRELAQMRLGGTCPALMVTAQRNRSCQLQTIRASLASPPTSERSWPPAGIRAPAEPRCPRNSWRLTVTLAQTDRLFPRAQTTPWLCQAQESSLAMHRQIPGPHQNRCSYTGTHQALLRQEGYRIHIYRR